MKRGVFILGTYLGAGVVVGGLAVYVAGITLWWLAALLWLNPWLCIVLAAGLIVLLSRGKTNAPKAAIGNGGADDQ